eukprot:TRINITY_DN11530_c0_g1_i1.p1 TRINITY_DN11530_c0_g1~~TRINITY_DN11530_c0_g1_i1.p1  ORF type:complete len:1008 (+),score=249.77 TRINITY_DN11530_c0_g1_i1:33-3056(+)
MQKVVLFCLVYLLYTAKLGSSAPSGFSNWPKSCTASSQKNYYECDLDDEFCTFDRCELGDDCTAGEWKFFHTSCSTENPSDHVTYDDPFNNQVQYQPTPAEFTALQLFYTALEGESSWKSSLQNYDVDANLEWFIDPETGNCCGTVTPCRRSNSQYTEICYSYLYNTAERGPCGYKDINQKRESMNNSPSNAGYRLPRDLTNDGWYGLMCGNAGTSSPYIRHIEVMLLSHNDLTGNIPAGVGSLQWLKWMFLQGNSISGSLPSTFGDLDELTHLYINDNELTSLGSGITSVSKLKKLYFANNVINDDISFISSLANTLEIFSGQNNLLKGNLPDTYPASLNNINLGNNKISGLLSASLLSSESMQYIRLNDNDLEGPIPNVEFGENLILLDLSNNDLSCRIPPSIEDATIDIDLRGNQFFCPVNLFGDNILIDSCVTIEQTSIDLEGGAEEIELLNAGVPDWTRINGVNLNTEFCTLQCYYKNIITSEVFIADANGDSDANQITCDTPDLSGGLYKICLGQDGRSIVSSENCEYIRAYYDCDGLCGDGICDTFTGKCICPLGKTGPNCDIHDCQGCNEPYGYCNVTLKKCVCSEDPLFLGPHCDISPSECDPECVYGVCNLLTGECECNLGVINSPTCNETICPICNPIGGDGCFPNGTCKCKEFWEGVLCNNPTKPCPGDCNVPTGGKFCDHVTGECVCNFGYDGENCEDLACPLDCSGNGVCDGSVGTCNCSTGWKGTACNTVDLVCDPPCCSQGTCNTTSGKCICRGRSAGPQCCRIDCKDDCSGNGECDFDTGICDCFEGYSGSTCQVGNFDCNPACNSTRGICDRSIGKCLCNEGFYGDTCDSAFCIDECNNRGDCNNVSGVCDCDEDYEGISCSLISCTQGCGNGTCDFRDGTCVCNLGWRSKYGEFCNIPSCPGNCSTNGDCSDEGICSCGGRWSGEACNIQTEDPVVLAVTFIICALVTLIVIVGIFVLWRHFKIQQLKNSLQGGEDDAMLSDFSTSSG